MEEEKRLELSLAPPGDQFAANNNNNNNNNGAKRTFQNSWSSSPTKKETSIISNKRVELAPVVGWPPVRSFRRNFAGNSPLSKPPAEAAGKPQKEKKNENQLYVKINMEGVPIGRKVNLSAYNSYQELSAAVDELFSGLLAAQMGSSVDGHNKDKTEEENKKKDLLDLNRQYTLVYEDNEGDRVLVGDVPWHMFILTVKRLLVLKTSETSSIPLSRNGKGRGSSDS